MKKIVLPLVLLISIISFSCNIQGQAFKMMKAQRGHTAHRGIVPPDEQGTTPTGKDYYIFYVKANKGGMVECINLTVITEGDTLYCKPKFYDGEVKKKVRTGEVVSFYAENDKSTEPNMQSVVTKCVMRLKLNDKPMTLNAKEIDWIIPQ